MGCFIAGLRDEIRLDVKVKQAKTLSDTIGVARLIEERNSLHKKHGGNSIFRALHTSPFQRNKPSTAVGLLGPPLTQKTVPISISSIRRISGQEARDHCEKGLCFYCDEKFVPRHRCQCLQLFMIEDCPLGPQTEDHDTNEELPTIEPQPEISFHAMVGTNHPQTLRMTGRNRNNEVIVLIDGGSTHNFIKQSIVKKLALPIISDKSFHVMVGNCEKIECTGKSSKIIPFIDHPKSYHYSRFLYSSSSSVSSGVRGCSGWRLWVPSKLIIDFHS